ncbi:MAG: VPLPA-CTERM sorting domain-containing protein [Pseudomonadota bacterium]
MSRYILVFCTLLLLIGLAVGTNAATLSYSVRGSVSANYSPPTGSGSASGDSETEFFQNGPLSLGVVTVSGPTSTAALNGASVTVNLNTGRINAFARTISLGGTLEQGQAIFNGELRDHLTFHLPEGMSSATVTVLFNIEGNVSGAAALETGGFLSNHSLNGSLVFGGSDGGVLLRQPFLDPNFSRTLSRTIEVVDGQRQFLKAQIFGNLTALQGSLLMDFSGQEAGIGGGPIANQFSTLSASPSMMGGNLSFALPDGVTFTTDSGAALTAVPLPAAAWFLLSGLILLGAHRSE